VREQVIPCEQKAVRQVRLWQEQTDALLFLAVETHVWEEEQEDLILVEAWRSECNERRRLLNNIKGIDLFFWNYKFNSL
jgi:hypothetical protein